MNLGRVILGLCALVLAFVPVAALLAQDSGYGSSVLAQPTSSTSSSIIASSEQEDIPPPDGEAMPEYETQLVAPDSFWLDPVVVPDDAAPAKGGSFLPGGFVEYCDCLRHVFGVEWLILHPLNEPTQTVILTDLLTEQQFTGVAEPSGGSGVRLWWGVEYGWLGYRIRYTHFGSDFIDPNPVVPNPPLEGSSRAFLGTYYLNANVFDFEMTQRFCWHSHEFNVSFGGRYAQLERNSTVIGYGTLGDGVQISGEATGANEMEGGGLTFSLAGIAPCHRHPCWNWFWSLRGSVLWVDQTAFARTHANATVKPPIGAGSADSEDKAFALSDDPQAIFIGEAQLGLEYHKPLCCICGDFIFRIAVEYQHWGTGDVLAGSESFALLAGGTPEFGALVESAAFAHDGDLDLFGLTIGIGLNY